MHASSGKHKACPTSEGRRAGERDQAAQRLGKHACIQTSKCWAATYVGCERCVGPPARAMQTVPPLIAQSDARTRQAHMHTRAEPMHTGTAPATYKPWHADRRKERLRRFCIRLLAFVFCTCLLRFVDKRLQPWPGGGERRRGWRPSRRLKRLQRGVNQALR